MEMTKLGSGLNLRILTAIFLTGLLAGMTGLTTALLTGLYIRQEVSRQLNWQSKFEPPPEPPPGKVIDFYDRPNDGKTGARHRVSGGGNR